MELPAKLTQNSNLSNEMQFSPWPGDRYVSQPASQPASKASSPINGSEKNALEKVMQYESDNKVYKRKTGGNSK